MYGDKRMGQKLSPKRELAELLGVSHNSMREALRTLDVNRLMCGIKSVFDPNNILNPHKVCES
jgi:FAD/FMN-containing dehydrogenase